MLLTVLYDAACPLCSRFRAWLAEQPLLVPVRLVPAGSPEARALFPTLDHARTLAEVTVVGDDGSVWTHERAWVMCLWATRAHRGLAERLARPAWLPLARGAAGTATGLRHLMAPGGGTGGDYPDDCAGSCSPRVAHQQG
ncbi:thiol-disulfide oxidoreductase DCC family protein [Nocardioides dongxiaopingii]|uniref:thiol-disulfide oxidoreductase DCC family protein n=1 Tax=Nocardioides dongxiaopingii TaxID=2576036 RepID=UPI0010C766E4|nr:DCC1-like thiol-disulfide oxidoreductase family protein [Nocardioides dongxiaopingii]